MKAGKLRWADDITDDRYDDAYEYLSMLWSPAFAARAIAALRNADLDSRSPSQILRAAGLKALPLDDTHVRLELAKALSDGQLQPVLCIKLKQGIVLADGWHRCSVAYHLAPERAMPTKLAPSLKDPFDA